MKNRWFVFIVIVILFLAGCSSTPNISGVWESDLDGMFFNFLSDLNFMVYETYEPEEVNETLIKGGYRFGEINGTQCFGFGYYPNASETVIGVSGTYEYPNEDLFILTVDDRCEFGWQDWETSTQFTNINFMRIK